jgi:hypothetical protein
VGNSIAVVWIACARQKRLEAFVPQFDTEAVKAHHVGQRFLEGHLFTLTVHLAYSTRGGEGLSTGKEGIPASCLNKEKIQQLTLDRWLNVEESQ